MAAITSPVSYLHAHQSDERDPSRALSREKQTPARFPDVLAHRFRKTTRSDEPAVVKSRELKPRTMETGLAQIAANKTGTPEISTGKIRSYQRDATEVRATQVRVGKIDSFQFRVAENQAREMLFLGSGKNLMHSDPSLKAPRFR